MNGYYRNRGNPALRLFGKCCQLDDCFEVMGSVFCTSALDRMQLHLVWSFSSFWKVRALQSRQTLRPDQAGGAFCAAASRRILRP